MKSENTPILYTDRLILRRFRQDDVLALFDLLSEEETNTFLPWCTLRHREEAEEFLRERFLSWYDKPFACRYAVCRKEDNRPIGYVWLADNESLDFGYGLKKEFWHRGIITEAALAVTVWLRQAGCPYITATHDINNPRSGAVMKKLGMRYTYSYVEVVQPKNVTVTFRLYQLNFDTNTGRVYGGYRDKYGNHFIEADV